MDLACAGCVGDSDIAAGAIEAKHLATGSVGRESVSFPYAMSNAPGGPATDVNCVNCVDGRELTDGAVGQRHLVAGLLQKPLTLVSGRYPGPFAFNAGYFHMMGTNPTVYSAEVKSSKMVFPISGQLRNFSVVLDYNGLSRENLEIVILKNGNATTLNATIHPGLSTESVLLDADSVAVSPGDLFVLRAVVGDGNQRIVSFGWTVVFEPT